MYIGGGTNGYQGCGLLCLEETRRSHFYPTPTNAFPKEEFSIPQLFSIFSQSTIPKSPFFPKHAQDTTALGLLFSLTQWDIYISVAFLGSIPVCIRLYWAPTYTPITMIDICIQYFTVNSRMSSVQTNTQYHIHWLTARQHTS